MKVSGRVIVHALAALVEQRMGSWTQGSIESLGEDDFSAGVFPEVNGPWASVIMVEHATLQHQLDFTSVLESITLHESHAHSLTALAYIHPDLRLCVEGPNCGPRLTAWVYKIEKILKGEAF